MNQAQIGQQGANATAWDAEQSTFEQMQADWNSAVAQTTSAVASAAAIADSDFQAQVAPAAAQEQSTIAQAAQTATDNWSQAQGTSWAATVAAEASAWTLPVFLFWILPKAWPNVQTDARMWMWVR